jgi:hypothetical protein
MAIHETKSLRPIDAGSAAVWAKVTAKARGMEMERVELEAQAGFVRKQKAEGRRQQAEQERAVSGEQ